MEIQTKKERSPWLIIAVVVFIGAIFDVALYHDTHAAPKAPMPVGKTCVGGVSGGTKGDETTIYLIWSDGSITEEKE